MVYTLPLPCRWCRLQEQALRRAADLHKQAKQSAKDGLAGARLVATDVARGDAKRAGSRVGGWVHRASTSAGMLYVARLLVSSQRSTWTRGCLRATQPSS